MRLLDIAAGVLVPVLAGAAMVPGPAPAADLSGSRTRARTSSGPAAAAPGPRLREVSVVAERFEFQPDRIEVEQGDHVRITVRSADGTHGFEIRSLGVRAKVPRDGEPITVEFDADRPGSYEIRCFEYCGTGHKQMKATLVVTPTAATR